MPNLIRRGRRPSGTSADLSTDRGRLANGMTVRYAAGLDGYERPNSRRTTAARLLRT